MGSDQKLVFVTDDPHVRSKRDQRAFDALTKGPFIELTPAGMDALLDALRPLVERADAENKGFHERTGDGWSGRLEGQVPVQGYGDVDEIHWYFRARYDGWSFGVGLSEDEAIDGKLYYCDGQYGEPFGYDAGWMPYRDAWPLIEASIAKFREGRS